MQAAIDRIMETYSLLVTLSPKDEAETRQRVVMHLLQVEGDENQLAIAGLQFLRGSRLYRKRRR